MHVWFTFIVGMICYVSAHSARRNLKQIPTPAPNINNEAYLGPWFVQYRLPGCGFDSSDTLTDYVQSLVRIKNGLASYDTWRNDVTKMCNTLSTMYFETQTPGLFRMKDPIGSIWSGIAIIVAVNGKRYNVIYGCSKISTIGDRCDDPFLTIYTRMIKPDPMTLAEIDSILRTAFGFSLASLPRTFHGNPCV